MVFLWLKRLIKRHTNPIPEAKAYRWKNRLSLAYMLLAWNAFGFVCYNVYNGKMDWAVQHGKKEKDDRTAAQQWADTLKIKDAKVYRISGFNVESYEIHNEDSTEKKNSTVPKGKTNVSS